MSIQRMPIPKKARNREATTWRLSISRELDLNELKAIAAVFLDGTKYHYLVQANVYPGITQLDGDYFGVRGRSKDLSQVARRWEEVEERFPELFPDSVLEYRVPAGLLDDVEPLAVDDLTQVQG